MKIIFIGQKGIGGGIAGGVEKHVEALSRRLSAHDHDVSVYARRHLYNDKNRPSVFHGVRMVYLPTVPTKHLEAIIHTLLAIFHVAFVQRSVDVIHFQSIGPSSLLWLMRLLKPRTVVIATMHAKCYEHSKWGSFAKNYLQLAEWLCCFFAQKVIVISEDLKKYVDRRYGITALFIPNGADFYQKTEPRECILQWHLAPREYYLFVGRLIPGKKADLLIAAYKKLQTTKKLVIVGGSAYTDDYVHALYATAKDDENIIFTGTQKSSIVRALMQNAYALVFPSESEGMSLVVLEAIAVQLPIIACDIVGNRMLLSPQTALLIPPNDVDALEEAMITATKHPEEMRQKAQNAYKERAEEFSWEYVAFKTTDLYYTLSNKK